MTDDLTKKKIDKDFININQKHERDYWTDKLNVSEKELRDACEKVGDNHPVEKVRKVLGK